jgi:hypothetical protein
VKQHRADRYQKQYDCYSHPSLILAVKGYGYDQRAELTPVAMANFTFAIVVSLASPIQPVATSKHDTEYTLRR